MQLVPLRHADTFANRGGLVDCDGEGDNGEDLGGDRRFRGFDGFLYIGRRSNIERFCGNFLQHQPSIPGRIIDGGNILIWTSLINFSILEMVISLVEVQNVLNFNLTLELRVPSLWNAGSALSYINTLSYNSRDSELDMALSCLVVVVVELSVVLAVLMDWR